MEDKAASESLVSLFKLDRLLNQGTMPHKIVSWKIN